MKRTFPEVLTIKMAMDYIRQEAGHSIYCEASLRRMAREGYLKCIQLAKKKKIFLFKSDIKLKLLDPIAA